MTSSVDLEEWVIRMLDGVVDDVGGVVPTRPQANNAASNLDDRVPY